MGKMKVLVVSTELDNYFLLSNAMKSDYVSFHYAKDKEDLESNWDLIIVFLDKSIPWEKSIKLIFNIKCSFKGDVIAILKDASNREKIQLMNMRITDYLESPINWDELRNRLIMRYLLYN